MAIWMRPRILRRLRWWIAPDKAGERGKAAAHEISDARFFLESQMDRPSVVAERALLWEEAKKIKEGEEADGGTH